MENLVLGALLYLECTLLNMGQNLRYKVQSTVQVQVQVHVYTSVTYDDPGCCFNLSCSDYYCRVFVKSYSVVYFRPNIIFFCENKYFQHIRVPSKEIEQWSIYLNFEK